MSYEVTGGSTRSTLGGASAASDVYKGQLEGEPPTPAQVPLDAGAASGQASGGYRGPGGEAEEEGGDLVHAIPGR